MTKQYIRIVVVLIPLLSGACATTKLMEAGRPVTERVVKYDNAYAYQDQFILPFVVERGGGKTSGKIEERWISMSLQEMDKARKQYYNVNPLYTIHRDPLPAALKSEGKLIDVWVCPESEGMGEHHITIYLPPTKAAANIQIPDPTHRSTNPLVIVGFPFAVVFDIVTFPVQAIMSINAFTKGITG